MPSRLSSKSLSASKAPLGIARATLLGLACGAIAIHGAAAQPYPAKPIKMISPFSAGGPPDVLGRLIGQKLSERFGYNITIDNRPGAGTTLATRAAAAADPDGYTLLWASTSVIAIVPAAGKVPYDPVKDLTPIGAMTAGPQVLLVNADVPAKSVKEFVAWVKAQPAKIAYGGGGGPASASNLIMSLFQKRSGIAMTNVSYRGTAQGRDFGVVAIKQLYATHYFHTALDVSVCVDDGATDAPHGFYLLTLKGSQQEGLTGVKGSILRKVVVDKR